MDYIFEFFVKMTSVEVMSSMAEQYTRKLEQFYRKIRALNEELQFYEEKRNVTRKLKELNLCTTQPKYDGASDFDSEHHLIHRHTV